MTEFESSEPGASSGDIKAKMAAKAASIPGRLPPDRQKLAESLNMSNEAARREQSEREPKRNRLTEAKFTLRRTGAKIARPFREEREIRERQSALNEEARASRSESKALREERKAEREEYYANERVREANARKRQRRAKETAKKPSIFGGLGKILGETFPKKNESTGKWKNGTVGSMRSRKAAPKKRRTPHYRKRLKTHKRKGARKRNRKSRSRPREFEDSLLFGPRRTRKSDYLFLGPTRKVRRIKKRLRR